MGLRLSGEAFEFLEPLRVYRANSVTNYQRNKNPSQIFHGA